MPLPCSPQGGNSWLGGPTSSNHSATGTSSVCSCFVSGTDRPFRPRPFLLLSYPAPRDFYAFFFLLTCFPHRLGFSFFFLIVPTRSRALVIRLNTHPFTRVWSNRTFGSFARAPLVPAKSHLIRRLRSVSFSLLPHATTSLAA